MGDWAASRLRSWPSDGLKMAHLQKCESWDNSRERDCLREREREREIKKQERMGDITEGHSKTKKLWRIERDNGKERKRERENERAKESE